MDIQHQLFSDEEPRHERLAERAQIFIDEIAAVSVPTGRPVPDESVIGRECYAFSEREDEVFDFIAARARSIFKANGVPEEWYDIQTDAIGNLFITYDGDDPSETVLMGSHADSVKDGGKYDGVAGVAGALAYLEDLVTSGAMMEKSFTVVVWRAEESSPVTGRACLGSNVANGGVTEREWEALPYKMEEGVTLRRHMDERKPGWFDSVLEEVRNPVIGEDLVLRLPSKDGTVKARKLLHGHEFHIEQNTVLERFRKHIGVGTAIGGSRRAELNTGAIKTYDIPVGVDKPHVHVTATITGEENHTGGTPHNPARHPTEPASHFRTDALVATAEFLEDVLAEWEEHVSNPDGSLHITGIDMPEAKGFTTIPGEQRIRIAVSAALLPALKNCILGMGVKSQRERGVKVSFASDEATALLPGSVRGLDLTQLRALLSIPLRVEDVARETLLKSSTLLGEIRATVTDFSLTHAGFKAKVDMRDVNPAAMDAAEKAVHDALRESLSALGIPYEEAVKKLKASAHVDLDADLRQRAMRIAKEAGLEAMEMPSLAGHDARSLQERGLGTSFLFAAHDGLSHRPDERMSFESTADVLQVSSMLMDELIGVTRPA